jgi:cytochrome c553
MRICQPLVMLVLAAGCTPPDEAAFPDPRLAQRHTTRRDAADEQGATPRLERPGMVRFHMERHFDDLRTVERLLVAGKLGEATTLAHMLTRPANDPGLATWKDEAGRVAAAATAVEHASTLDQALQREPLIGAACGACHERTHARLRFTTAPAPPDRPGPEARMARHQWAVDRLWEALVGADELRWTAGLQILATTPSPEVQPREAAHLQALARAALTSPSSSASSRATVYGDMLATCAACHATRPMSVGAAAHP